MSFLPYGPSALDGARVCGGTPEEEVPAPSINECLGARLSLQSRICILYSLAGSKDELLGHSIKDPFGGTESYAKLNKLDKKGQEEAYKEAMGWLDRHPYYELVSEHDSESGFQEALVSGQPIADGKVVDGNKIISRFSLYNPRTEKFEVYEARNPLSPAA